MTDIHLYPGARTGIMPDPTGYFRRKQALHKVNGSVWVGSGLEWCIFVEPWKVDLVHMRGIAVVKCRAIRLWQVIRPATALGLSGFRGGEHLPRRNGRVWVGMVYFRGALEDGPGMHARDY